MRVLCIHRNRGKCNQSKSEIELGGNSIDHCRVLDAGIMQNINIKNCGLRCCGVCLGDIHSSRISILIVRQSSKKQKKKKLNNTYFIQ